MKPRLCYVAYPTSMSLQAANAVQTYSTLRELQRIDPECTAFIPRMTSEATPFAALNVTFIPRIGIGRLSRLYQSTLWYYLERTAFVWVVFAVLWWAKLRGRGYDVIYVREVICAFWLSKWAPRLLGAQVIYEIHHLESTNHSRPKERWAQRLVAHIDRITVTQPARIVSLTDTFRQELVAAGWRAAEHIDVLPDSYNDTIYTVQPQHEARSVLGLPESPTILITYAGLTFAYRNLELLIHAFAALPADIKAQARLVFVGGRPKEVAELATHVTQEDITESVVFVPVQPQAVVAQYLAASDILTIPGTVTDSTASPLKMFEYMAMGRVLICPDMPALREIVADDGACLFTRGSVTDLTRVLLLLIHDANLREQIAQRALELVAPHTYRHRAQTLHNICVYAHTFVKESRT